MEHNFPYWTRLLTAVNLLNFTTFKQEMPMFKFSPFARPSRSFPVQHLVYIAESYRNFRSDPFRRKMSHQMWSSENSPPSHDADRERIAENPPKRIAFHDVTSLSALFSHIAIANSFPLSYCKVSRTHIQGACLKSEEERGRNSILWMIFKCLTSSEFLGWSSLSSHLIKPAVSRRVVLIRSFNFRREYQRAPI